MNARKLKIASWIFFALAFLFFCVSGWFHLRQQIDSTPSNWVNAVKGTMFGLVAYSMGIAVFIDTIRKEIYGLDPSYVEARRGGLSAFIVSIALFIFGIWCLPWQCPNFPDDACHPE
jgi:hypothetical protein